MSLPVVLISEEEIQTRVAELAAEISSDYAEADDLVMVGVLKGAFVFLADLSRKMTIPSRASTCSSSRTLSTPATRSNT